MKYSLITLLFLLQFYSGFSQDLSYRINGTYSRPVTKEKLIVSNSMNDISPGYPTSWINEYVTAEISATCNGVAMKAVSANDILSTTQKNILQKADLGTDVIVDIKYKSENAATREMEIRTMHFAVTIVPEVEAAYSGGHQQMTQYLKEQAIDKISSADAKQLKQAIIKFTINEEGEIANAQIAKTSGDPKTDKLLLRTINKMPKWKPAENAQGIKVRQDFEFSVGSEGGC
ncbi:MAG TPA: energy transducer TonB [Saprospiraceae bacterium]|nr:energy transducer TonB [Saprospiraceae bacterium]